MRQPTARLVWFVLVFSFLPGIVLRLPAHLAEANCIDSSSSSTGTSTSTCKSNRGASWSSRGAHFLHSQQRQQQQQQQIRSTSPTSTMSPSLSGKQQNETSKTDESSSVLRELKETVRQQSKEIEILRKQLEAKGGAAAASPLSTLSGGGGGHSSSPSSSLDELSHYLASPFYRVAFSRVGWLCLFLTSLSMTAVIMNGFEHTLERQIELAYFVPLLAGHGGNTGGQSVGTVLSALSAKVAGLNDASRIIRKEALSGLAVGTFLGLCVGTVSHFVMGVSSHVSTVVTCTLPLVSVIASSLGATIPFVCLFLGLDPSLIAAPAMTSLVDVLGLMSYFIIANSVFGLFGIEL